jgi:hypothetical protein
VWCSCNTAARLKRREVEVELGKHGQQKVLDRIERRLPKVGTQRAGSASRLGRLLANRLPQCERVEA